MITVNMGRPVPVADIDRDHGARCGPLRL